MTLYRYRGKLPLAEMLRLRARGWSSERIATHLGCRRGAVDYVFERLGVGNARRHRRWSVADNERLAEMWAAGLLLRDIALRLGRGVGQVSNARRRLGLPRRQPAHRRFTAAEQALIESEWATASLPALAVRLGRRQGAVANHALRKLGLPRRGPRGCNIRKQGGNMA